MKPGVKPNAGTRAARSRHASGWHVATRVSSVDMRRRRRDPTDPTDPTDARGREVGSMTTACDHPTTRPGPRDGRRLNEGRAGRVVGSVAGAGPFLLTEDFFKKTRPDRPARPCPWDAAPAGRAAAAAARPARLCRRHAAMSRHWGCFLGANYAI